ncbi:uncharacterized protein [Spinacia oleracea]|uniref:DDE Tnp4 domain-containing protein n=1 Tax=Spinacia oleracea TaxID=3562 RepID=A0ABM3RHF9_SPIOL|nr:uncharacterized protein LOC110786735 [Spinacia oleracea]
MNKVVENDVFLQERRNAAGKLGLSRLQKCTAAIKMLAYGLAPDATDEYMRMGMNGSIDCMHLKWKNCPTAWRSKNQGRNGKATVILEVVEDQDLWILHSFFGIPGSCNDLNVLDRSPVFDDVLQGNAPPINFQARFTIVRQPSLAYDEDILYDIMKDCIILHNMIVEDERDTYVRADVLRRYYEEDLSSLTATVNNGEPFEFQTGQPVSINAYLGRRTTLHSSQTHHSFKEDLIEHN